MKYEWKRNEKNLYGVNATPTQVDVPSQHYIMIRGEGNPNNQDFTIRVSTLYALAYGIKMSYKAMAKEQELEISDYSVYPLEGVWQKKAQREELIKEELIYTIMIKQPDFITPQMVEEAQQNVKKKKPSLLLDEVYFSSMPKETCVQILHIGSFDEEPKSFTKLDDFVKEQGWKRTELWHREIYLNNANRVMKSKLKTILRYPIEK